MVNNMDDIQIIITLITFFVSNLFAVYKLIDKLSDRISRLEGQIQQLDKTLNIVLQKMLNGDS